ncbi:hypothetical protein [Thalassotalea castellviae]|uniref:DUF4340 domain-containing protein n=1 Tax=Thalassotalea castellviae TaxID=3075612 RepID=A0ABU3A1W1_9GAMM|nr:hypothetical protein [Thalassotalea sp. W431]MDT0604167.1 hypothetical protein [Thalassotalea sp. W431]
MIKFSRAGWNNVIIFAVLGFILLINATHDNVFTSAENTEQQVRQETPILGDNAVVLTLTINQQIKIERIGKTWRAIPDNISGQALEQMMMAWQQSIATPVDEPIGIDEQLALLVSVELAGHPQALLLSLHTTEHELLIFNHQTQLWSVLPLQIYAQLLPTQIFGN